MGSYVAVNCNKCGYLDEGELSEEYAIKGWNERAAQDKDTKRKEK
jgi:hypothetical protein